MLQNNSLNAASLNFMPKLSTSSPYAIVLFLMTVGSFFLAIGTVFCLWKLGFALEAEGSAKYKSVNELVVRFSLLALIIAFYLYLYFTKTAREWFYAERWRVIMLALFALGILSSAGDPFHTIQTEGNWIRYSTAGALGAAGLIGLYCAFTGRRPILDRFIGCAFGFLLVAAGADEIFQFHEKVGEYGAMVLPSQMPVDAQDMLTLGVAVIGVLVLAGIVLFLRVSRYAATILQDSRYRRVLHLFGFAVFTFMFAMLLDSFDTYLVAAVDYVRGEDPGVWSWLKFTDPARFANSLEEFLEYLSALFLLMMIGTLFSLRALGCGKPAPIS